MQVYGILYRLWFMVTNLSIIMMNGLVHCIVEITC